MLERPMSRAESTSSITRRPGRRTLQYLLMFIAWVLVVDAVVGERGLSAMIHARRQYRALHESLAGARTRSEEHTSELQSPDHLVCRLLLEKKKRERSNHHHRSH